MAVNSQVRRSFGLRILKSGHKEIRRLKNAGHEPEIHGNKFWNSSYLTMDYLKTHPIRKRARVMEIGCGWGLLGIYCAKMFDARVTGVDADKHVLPYMELHAKINGVKVNMEQNSFEKLSTARLSEFDVIVGSDICFWDYMTMPLYNLIRRALRAGVKQVIISDPCRPPFTELATRCMDRLANADTIERAVMRPVHASGELLIVKNR
jgi:predicted nicotinamide N-methyase